MGEHLVREGNKLFLENDIADFGSICWWVSAKMAEEGEESDSPVRGNIRVSDCANHIYLSFECDDEEDYASRMKKIDDIITELNNFRKAFRKAKGALPNG